MFELFRNISQKNSDEVFGQFDISQGLTFRTARLLWERNSTLKSAHKISYALGPRVRAVIWKEPGSDELAALESLLER